MRAMTPLGERAARLPAGPPNPGCNGGMSFTALRDSAPLPPGASAGKFFVERLRELTRARRRCRGEWRCARGAGAEDSRRPRAARRAQVREHRQGFAGADGCSARRRRRRCRDRPPPRLLPPQRGVIEPGNVAPTPRTVDGVDYIEGRDLTLIYEGKKCIHSRFCVTWGPKVFIANVKGPWINPDAMATER